MLERLRAIKSLDDLTAFGIELATSNSSLEQLQDDLKDAGIIFFVEDYLPEDLIMAYSESSSKIKDLLCKSSEEPEPLCYLHILQIIEKLCPLASNIVAMLLRRTTC